MPADDLRSDESDLAKVERLMTTFWRAEIAQAEAQERERCARIAEDWHPMLYAPEMAGSHPRDVAYNDAKSAIAKAIRSGNSSKSEGE